MFSYTKLNVNTVSFIVTLLLYFLINLLPINVQVFGDDEHIISKTTPIVLKKEEEQSNNSVMMKQEKVENNAISTAKNTTTKKEQTSNKKTENNTNAWKIIIPIINLDAPIAEGTSTEVMNAYVGHFDNTPKLNGNVALGAHNRGYPVNYFQNIKKLKKGDIIKYIYNNVRKEYIVETVTVIKETDWTYLANTKDDRITLITCVENEPEYRRCIQGVLKM